MNVELPLERRAEVHRALGDVHRLAIVDALRLSDRTPSELAETTGLGSNLVAFHLKVLERAGLIERTASQGDARRRYVRLHPDVLGSLTPPVTVVADDVVFVCTRNAARSPIAAALWERCTGHRARSAGTAPADEVDPGAVAAASRHGLDLAGRRPHGYDQLGPAPDLVVSVCDRARESDPPFAVPLVHWSVPDPAGGDAASYDVALTELEARVRTLAAHRRAPAGS